MEYRPLGRTGVTVSQLCLGAMMFGSFGNPDHDESIRIIHQALDAGINFIDAADFYSAGESEEIVGKALPGGRRENVILATKVGMPFGEDPNHRGASRRWIMEAVEGSLRRLGTDWIDLYLECPGLRDRRGPMDGRAPRPRTVPHRAAFLFDPRPCDRA
jgi:aryl-alcohol dehydrogenase-like predicted oxidoreductase